MFEEAGVVGLLGLPFPSITYETRRTHNRHLASEANRHTECNVTDPPLSITEPSLGELAQTLAISAQTGFHDSLEHDPSQLEPSDIPQHSHNHMTIFPLYVQHVFGAWPELNRSRGAFSIEQAEGFLAHRPEYLAVLQAVKEGNLHRVCSRSRKVNC